MISHCDEQQMNRNILLVGQDFDRSILNKLGGCQLSQKMICLFICLFIYLFILLKGHNVRESHLISQQSPNYDWCCIAKINQ